ncbi:ATPase, AAA family, partial [Wolbachia pipientis wUni]
MPLPLILALATLSILVLALSYKIISNNKKIEVERNKFAQKEQE